MGLYREVAARVDADNAEWRLTGPRAFTLAVVPLLIATFGLVVAPFEGLYRALADEDGLVEWVEFALVVAMTLLALAIALVLWRRGHRWLALLYVVAALGAVFVAGEEVSWGQRIFGWATPEDLEDVNRQGETNIHNIGIVLRLFNFGTMAVALAAIILPILRWTVWRDRPRSVARYVLIPPFALASAFAIPFFYRAYRLVLLPEAGARISKYAEFAELCFYFGLAVFFLMAYRAIRADDGVDAGAGADDVGVGQAGPSTPDSTA
jgi:hypothetical protein